MTKGWAFVLILFAIPIWGQERPRIPDFADYGTLVEEAQQPLVSDAFPETWVDLLIDYQEWIYIITAGSILFTVAYAIKNPQAFKMTMSARTFRLFQNRKATFIVWMLSIGLMLGLYLPWTIKQEGYRGALHIHTEWKPITFQTSDKHRQSINFALLGVSIVLLTIPFGIIYTLQPRETSATRRHD